MLLVIIAASPRRHRHRRRRRRRRCCCRHRRCSCCIITFAGGCYATLHQRDIRSNTRPSEGQRLLYPIHTLFRVSITERLVSSKQQPIRDEANSKCRPARSILPPEAEDARPGRR